MRIALHDYAGHPFQVQLSRELARRDHEVLHLHCSSLRTGKGALAKAPDDPPSLSFGAVSLKEEFERYSPWRRVLQEHQYAARLLSSLEKFRPELVMSANTPLFVQRSSFSGNRTSWDWARARSLVSVCASWVRSPVRYSWPSSAHCCAVAVQSSSFLRISCQSSKAGESPLTVSM